MSDGVLKQIDGPIARITINRPEARNALDLPTVALMTRYLREVEVDPAVRCVVITGAGAHFMAGGDMGDFARTLSDPDLNLRALFEDRVMVNGNQFPIVLERMRKPVITAVRGGAAGGGLGLALASDFVICSETAFFVAAHVNVGLSPDNGTAWYLTRLIGERAAKRMLMLGQRLDVHEAQRLGMVDEIVPDDRLEAAVDELAGRLAAMPPRSVGHIKDLVNGAARRSLAESLQVEAQYLADCAEDPNFREGVTAFLERRKPVFR